MKFSENALRDYFSKFGSIKIMVWVVALGVIAAYGLLDSGSNQPIGNPQLQQGQYTQPLQQPVPQTGQYQQGSQQFPSNSQQQPMMQPRQQQFPGMNNQMPQMQQNGGYPNGGYPNGGYPNGSYPNGSGSNYPSNTANAYTNSQGGDYQQKETLNYGY